MRLLLVVVAGLLIGACWSEQRASEADAGAARLPIDFRFGPSACDARPRIPGLLVWDWRGIFLRTTEEARVTIKEVGEGLPDGGVSSTPAEGRYLRVALKDETHTIELYGVRTELPFSVGDKVRYSSSYAPFGFGAGDFGLTLRAPDGEVLLRYAHVGDLGNLEMPGGLEVDPSEELCSREPMFCGGTARAATFRDAQGASTRLEPGEARSFAGYDIYLHQALMLPEGGSYTCFDGRANTIDLLLLRTPR